MLDPLKREFYDKGTVQFYVRARPGMPSTKTVEVMDDGSIKIDIAAEAADGKANAQLIRYLAEEFGVGKGQIQIISGATTRLKLIRISMS